jgi:hypothetical protein
LDPILTPGGILWFGDWSHEPLGAWNHAPIPTHASAEKVEACCR